MGIKILIINLHSSSNAGDDVLTRVTLDQLDHSFQSAEIILSMNDPMSYIGFEQTVGSFMTWFKAGKPERRLVRFIKGLMRLTWSFLIAIGYRLIGKKIFILVPDFYHPLLKAYTEADLVISSAGNFLYSSGRLGFSFLIAFYSMAYTWLVGKPLYCMPQTIGPLTRTWEKCLTKWIVSKMELVFVREDISVQELKNLNCWRDGCYLVPDLAFAFPQKAKHEAELMLGKHGITVNADVPLLGMTLMNWGAQNLLFKNQGRYETAVSDIIRYFISQYHGKVILFPQVTGPSLSEDDRIPSRRVYNRLSDLHHDLKLIDSHVEPEILKSAYGLMDAFIGTRLHSNIFALSEYIPVIAIQYQYKTRGILEGLCLENWILDIEEINSENLIILFDQLWQGIDDLRLYLKRTMPGIVQEASNVGNRIKKDFYEKYRENSSS